MEEVTVEFDGRGWQDGFSGWESASVLVRSWGRRRKLPGPCPFSLLLLWFFERGGCCSGGILRLPRWRSCRHRRALCPLVLPTVGGQRRGGIGRARWVTPVGCPLRLVLGGWRSLGRSGRRTIQSGTRRPSRPYRREYVWPGEGALGWRR